MTPQRPVAVLATAPGCPYCPTMKLQLQQIHNRGLLADLQIIDVSKAPDFAAQHQIRSVPWLKIDDLVFTGNYSLGELEHWVSQASSDDGIREYLSNELESGRLASVATLIHTHPTWLTIAVTLLADMQAPMQSRIGISALIESETEQALLKSIQPMLIAYTQNADARVRGDACHLLGHIKDNASIQALHACLQDSDATVREIAGESLVSLT